MNERKASKFKIKMEKGITLIALIITIVVLLILAVVAISSIQNDGILSYANNAAIAYNQAQKNEQDILDGYLSYMPGNSGNVETITTETSYVGCYVNLDADVEPDGIIYIDLAKTASGSWGGNSYTITNVTSGLKDYTVIGEHTTDEFGTAKVIEAVSGSTGTERFYVMALEDVNPGTSYCCYAAAPTYEDEGGNLGISDYSSITAIGVGAGETNTSRMIEEWEAGTYGATDTINGFPDVWGVIQDEVAEGWYVPSLEEWLAFASAFDVHAGNFGAMGLLDYYWSSSLYDSISAWEVRPAGATVQNTGLEYPNYVRLGTSY